MQRPAVSAEEWLHSPRLVQLVRRAADAHRLNPPEVADVEQEVRIAVWEQADDWGQTRILISPAIVPNRSIHDRPQSSGPPIVRRTT